MKNRFFSTLILLMMVLAVSAAKKPKYIFYFIGDGMGLSPVLVAETYNQTVLGNKENPLLMLQFPVASVATSYSASHTITDSAAGGTALATGHKTKNGMLGV
ncbi:MAG: alkaline phosphatase, partial [Bacteroidaceae bacterium]|nr:alkaline phosphatase [Bacteroidaceae bacterium]